MTNDRDTDISELQFNASRDAADTETPTVPSMPAALDVFRPLRGFALLSPERRRELASKGGRLAHEKGVAHTWDSAQAKEAGRRGGLASAAKKAQAKGADRG